MNEERRAQPTDPPDLENPELLDPAITADVVLLTFDDSGSAQPAKSKEENAEAYQRAKTSIEIYHLNHPKTVPVRGEVMRKVRDLVAKADTAERRRMAGEAGANRTYAELMEQIADYVDESAQFSAAARAALAALRGGSGTAKAFF